MSLIYLIHGPNFNMLGRREPEIYGSQTLPQLEQSIIDYAKPLGFDVECFQSNYEGKLIDIIHQAKDKADAIIINPAAYSHTSIAILDALKIFEKPIIEVHISDIATREDFRKHSYVSLIATKVITGLGKEGYLRAVDALKGL